MAQRLVVSPGAADPAAGGHRAFVAGRPLTNAKTFTCIPGYMTGFRASFSQRNL
jgi:hypothetical protein